MNLQEVKSNVPDNFYYRHKYFRMTHYSKEGGYGKNRQRSKEIVWEAEDGSSIYLNGNNIDYETWR